MDFWIIFKIQILIIHNLTMLLNQGTLFFYFFCFFFEIFIIFNFHCNNIYYFNLNYFLFKN
jgi:hypothetical protein